MLGRTHLENSQQQLDVDVGRSGSELLEQVVKKWHACRAGSCCWSSDGLSTLAPSQGFPAQWSPGGPIF